MFMRSHKVRVTTAAGTTNPVDSKQWRMQNQRLLIKTSSSIDLNEENEKQSSGYF